MHMLGQGRVLRCQVNLWAGSLCAIELLLLFCTGMRAMCVHAPCMACGKLLVHAVCCVLCVACCVLRAVCCVLCAASRELGE